MKYSLGLLHPTGICKQPWWSPTAFGPSSVRSLPHTTKTCPPKLYHLFIYHTDLILEQWHGKGSHVDLCSSISDNTRYRISDKPALWFSGSSFYPKSSCYSFIDPQHQPILKLKPIQVVSHSVAVPISHQQCRHTLCKTDENKTFKWQQIWVHRSVTHRFTFIPANDVKRAIAVQGPLHFIFPFCAVPWKYFYR